MYIYQYYILLNRVRACRRAILLRILGSLFVHLLIRWVLWLRALMPWRLLKGDLEHKSIKNGTQLDQNRTPKRSAMVHSWSMEGGEGVPRNQQSNEIIKGIAKRGMLQRGKGNFFDFFGVDFFSIVGVEKYL